MTAPMTPPPFAPVTPGPEATPAPAAPVAPTAGEATPAPTPTVTDAVAGYDPAYVADAIAAREKRDTRMNRIKNGTVAGMKLAGALAIGYVNWHVGQINANADTVTEQWSADRSSVMVSRDTGVVVDIAATKSVNSKGELVADGAPGFNGFSDNFLRGAALVGGDAVAIAGAVQLNKRRKAGN